MNNDNLLSSISLEADASRSLVASRELCNLLDTDACIGDLLSINYQDAQVLVHDYAREKVRGLPHGSFLIASRLIPGASEWRPAEDEETCLVLLRIISDCPLPNTREMEGFRF